MADWGDVPTWLSAIATAGALIAAVAAGVIAYRVYRIESRRDEKAAWKDRLAQASLLGAWTVAWHDAADVQGDLDRRRGEGVLVSNESAAMIYDLTISATIYGHNKRGKTLRLANVPPGRFFVEATDDKFGWKFPCAVEDFPGVLLPVMKKDDWKVWSLMFRDSANQRWRRGEDGVLQELVPESEPAVPAQRTGGESTPVTHRG